MTLAQIGAAAARHGLDVFGAFHPGPDDGCPPRTGTLVLLGPLEPGFWAQVTQSPEFRDAAPDPLDRWSERVIAALARETGAEPLFPFGGPPFHPFQSWAQRSGRAAQSPVGLLVHDTAGLWLSYRGALALPGHLNLPEPDALPCATCRDRPCETACPVGALGAGGYDLAACHAYLDVPGGAHCMTGGCRARAACPVSRAHARVAAQSHFHMKAFHPCPAR